MQHILSYNVSFLLAHTVKSRHSLKIELFATCDPTFDSQYLIFDDNHLSSEYNEIFFQDYKVW